MLKVSVSKAQFNAPVGLYPQEEKTFNQIEIDAEVIVNADIDNLPLIDYTLIFERIKTVMQEKHQTLETIVGAVYKALKRIRPDARIEVRVRKLHPPLNGNVAFTEVSFKD